jgi:hypothetical protein
MIRDSGHTTTGTRTKFTVITEARNRQSRNARPICGNGTPRNVAYSSSPSAGLMTASVRCASCGNANPAITPTERAAR